MKIKILIAVVVSLMLGLTALCFFSGCSTLLKKPETAGLTENCRMFLECMYYIQSGEDKSICSTFAAGCKGANDYILCADSDSMDIRDCLLMIKK